MSRRNFRENRTEFCKHVEEILKESLEISDTKKFLGEKIRKIQRNFVECRKAVEKHFTNMLEEI